MADIDIYLHQYSLDWTADCGEGVALDIDGADCRTGEMLGQLINGICGADEVSRSSLLCCTLPAFLMEKRFMRTKTKIWIVKDVMRVPILSLRVGV